jgi:hypothetical protein
MKIEVLIFVGLFWFVPVMVGLWFSVGIWLFSERFNYRIAAIFRALAVAGTFTPGYVPDVGFVPVPASVFLFFTPSDSSFIEQASAAIPPIFIVWLFLIPIFIFVGHSLRKGKFGLTYHSSGTPNGAP